MKKIKIPVDCYFCGGEVRVSAVKCKDCGTEISGDFSEINSEKGILIDDEEILNFIKIFIFAEGNIKQAEKILNCSYPKIKNYLKKAKKALNIDDNIVMETSEEILEKLEKGIITAEEATEKLSKIKEV